MLRQLELLLVGLVLSSKLLLPLALALALAVLDFYLKHALAVTDTQAGTSIVVGLGVWYQRTASGIRV